MYTKNLSDFTWFYKGDGLNAYFCLALKGAIRFKANCSYFRYTEKPDWWKLCCFWIKENDIFLEKPSLLNI